MNNTYKLDYKATMFHRRSP